MQCIWQVTRILRQSKFYGKNGVPPGRVLRDQNSGIFLSRRDIWHVWLRVLIFCICFAYARKSFLSYPPVDDRVGPWNTAGSITLQLYHIGHVTSLVFHCFKGCPYHLVPLPSLWGHDFSPDTHSATNRRSNFRNLFVHYLMNRSFMASLESFCS